MPNNFFTEEYFKLHKLENAMEIPEIANSGEDFEELNRKGKILCTELKRLENIPQDFKDSLKHLENKMFTGNRGVGGVDAYNFGPESKAFLINYLNGVKVLAQDAKLKGQDLTKLISYCFEDSCAAGMRERGQNSINYMRGIENNVNGGLKIKYQTRKEILIEEEVKAILNRAGYGPDVHVVTRLKNAIADDFGLEKPRVEFGNWVAPRNFMQIHDYVSSEKHFKDFFEGFDSDIRGDCKEAKYTNSQAQKNYIDDLAEFARNKLQGIVQGNDLFLGRDEYLMVPEDKPENAAVRSEMFCKVNLNLPYLVMLVDMRDGLKEGLLKPEVAKYTSPGMIKLAALVGQNVYESDELQHPSLKIEKTPITADELIAKVQASTHKDRKEVKDAILEIEIEKKAQQCSALIMGLNDRDIKRLAHLINKHEKDGDRKYPAFFETMLKDPDVKEKFVAVAREVKRLDENNSIQTTAEEIFYKMVDFFMWLFDKEIFDINLAEKEVFKNRYLTKDVSATQSFTEFVKDALPQEQKAAAPAAL